jgi:acetyltransferase
MHAVIPAFGTAANPVDITGQFVAEPSLLEKSVAILLADPNVHVGVVWIQLMEAHVETLLEIFGRIKAAAPKPFVVCWVAASEQAVRGLHALGIAVLRGAEPAIDALAGLCRYAAARRVRLEETVVATDAGAAADVAGLPAGQVPSSETQALLEASGIACAPLRIARSPQEAAAIARTFERPVALKVESPDIAHKTECGGVVLALDTDTAVRDAYADILRNVSRHHRDARIVGVAVQPMAPEGIELVVGLQRDPVFGVVVMVGLGGIFIEALHDVVFRKAPLGQAQALAMLDALQGRPVLDGVRGRPAVSRAAVADLLVRVSLFGAAQANRLQTLDLNPVIACGASLHVVDWLLVLE